MRKTQLICAIASLAILAVAANTQAAETATGEITEVGKDFVVLKVKEKSMRMQVDSASQITLDGKKAALTQLKKGHKATVTFKKEGTKFTAEKIVASSNNTASLLPVVLLDDEKALRYTGKIKAVNKTTVSVMKADAKKAFDFEVGSDAVIKVNGKAASLKDLKAGQNVIVTYVKKAGKLHAKTITATSA